MPIRFTWILAVLACAGPIGLAQPAAVDTSRVGPLHIEQFGAYHAAIQISQESGIPIGVDVVQIGKESTIEFDFPGGTVDALLDAFVAQAPEYRWEQAEDGVIHVSRVGGHVSLLDVTIDFPGAKNVTREQVWDSLATIPELSAWMNANHCARQEFLMGKEFKRHNGPISIPSGHMSLMQLLDTVAVESGEKHWVVLQSPPPGECRVTIMLW